jgi:hypothetical protein
MLKVLTMAVSVLAMVGGDAAVAKPAARAARSAPEQEYAASYAKDYFLAKNGYEQIVRVKFLATSAAKAIVPEGKLSTIANLADFRCKMTAKNQLSYIPFRLFIYDGDDGTLASVKVAVEWIGKNGYGAEAKEACYFQLKSDFTPYDPNRGF